MGYLHRRKQNNCHLLKTVDILRLTWLCFPHFRLQAKNIMFNFCLNVFKTVYYWFYWQYSRIVYTPKSDLCNSQYLGFTLNSFRVSHYWSVNCDWRVNSVCGLCCGNKSSICIQATQVKLILNPKLNSNGNGHTQGTGNTWTLNEIFHWNAFPNSRLLSDLYTALPVKGARLASHITTTTEALTHSH